MFVVFRLKYMIGNDLANSLLLDQALFEESNEACKIFSDLIKKQMGSRVTEEMCMISKTDRDLQELNLFVKS